MTTPPDPLRNAPGDPDEPGRDIDLAGFDTSLGDESTGGEAAEEAVGAHEGEAEAPEPES